MNNRLHPLFDMEGEIGAEAPNESVEMPSVVAEGIEPSGDGIAPTPPQEPTEDVTKQQSFANRLREEKERAVAEERTTWEKQQNEQLERIAKFYNYDSAQEYLAALEEAELQDRANKQNMDPEVLKRLEQLESEAAEGKQLKQKHQQQQKYQEFRDNVLAPFAKEKGADADALENFMRENQVFNLNLAYDAMRTREIEAKYADDIKKTEADTIKKIQQNALTSPGAASQGDVDHASNFSQLSIEEKRRMIEDVKAGRRTSFN